MRLNPVPFDDFTTSVARPTAPSAFERQAAAVSRIAAPAPPAAHPSGPHIGPCEPDLADACLDERGRGRHERSGECSPISSMSPSTAIRRPLALRLGLAQERDRRAHRGRIGVVALVDQREPAAIPGKLVAAPAALRRPAWWPRAAIAFSRSPPAASTAAEHGHGILGDVPAGRAHRHFQRLPAEDRGARAGALGARHEIEQAELGLRIGAETVDMRRTPAAFAAFSRKANCSLSRVEDGMAVRHDTRRSRPWRGDLLEARKFRDGRARSS
jgi:hypothetical protein